MENQSLAGAELSARLVDWVEHAIAPQAKIVGARRLYGGISSIMYSIDAEAEGIVGGYVLRQFDDKDWLREEPDLALHEADSLRWAARTGQPAPRIVAWDESGSECGIPAVLMTRLEGSVVLAPSHMGDWLRGMASALAGIHSAKPEDIHRRYYTYCNLHALKTPAWSAIPGQWADALKIVQGPQPVCEMSFIHRDYHPANVLWKDGSVSGIVDWVNACRGPAGIDLGHCRLNLALLHGVAAADGFLDAYLEFAGKAFRYDPYWDLLSVVDTEQPRVYRGWTDLGVTGLTVRLMEERLDAYLASLMERVRST